MISITRRFTFAAGHRLLGHESGCRNMHGHNYVAEVTVEGPLDTIGRVLDFSAVKKIIGDWIEENWDHAFIFNTEDVEVRAALNQCPGKVYEMIGNPTAENMAALMLTECSGLLDSMGLYASRVVLWETENCRATVS